MLALMAKPCSGAFFQGMIIVARRTLEVGFLPARFAHGLPIYVRGAIVTEVGTTNHAPLMRVLIIPFHHDTAISALDRMPGFGRIHLTVTDVWIVIHLSTPLSDGAPKGV